MISLLGYTFIQQIYEGNNSLIYRGYRNSDHLPIVAKLLKGEYPNGKDLAAFQLEYTLLKKLQGLATVDVYEQIPYGNSLIIIMANFGVSLMDILTKEAPLKIPEFLNIAIKITTALESVHTQHIIHKDINPSNILWDEKTNTVKIIDFGISSIIAHEEAQLSNLQILEGSLPYLSPEQTGRMNRGIDYRTDFYSLGIVFYEMITGNEPFKFTDPLQIIHAHIAKLPIPPAEVNSAIPETISNIILKLMAKNAEDRYQSIFGIKHDLIKCLDEYNQTGKIKSFPIGKHDISSQLLIPEKLYGRVDELQQLLDSFERSSKGPAELILVSGHPGVGKSRLIYEIQKSIVAEHGYFISGKFEQYTRNKPYATFIQAFKDIIHQILTEDDASIKLWKEKILNALGPNGQVIIEFIPALTRIIGKQPSVPELDSLGTQNRFNLVFLNLVQALASEEHPLVIFFDDLQWADSSSIKLLEKLLTNIDSRYFLIIGAYRNNDIDVLEPIITTIKNMKQVGVSIFEIILKPLNISDVSNLISDTLHMSHEKIQALAEICYQKTQGNPFFLIQFLRELFHEQIISFNTARGRWDFQITRIQQKGFTDNVVEFMAKKVRELPKLTQNILQLASCLGSTFDIETLAIVAQQSTKQVSEHLWPVLQEGLILPLDEGYKYAGEYGVKNAKYQFLHDRVLQAAYGLTSENNITHVHLSIGRLLLENTPQDKISQNALNIISHYNLSLNLISDPKEKDTVAHINLLAGQQAKLCIAYEQAFSCFKAGMSLLSEDNWKTQYSLSLSLYTEAADTASVIKAYPEMKTWLDCILKNARTALDKAKAYQIQSVYLLGQNKLLETIDSGLIALSSLDIHVSKNISKLGILWEFVCMKRFFLRKKIEDIYNDPVKEDPYAHAIMQLTKTVMQAMYLASPMLFAQFALKGSERFFKSHGVIPDLVLFLMSYAMICMNFNEIERGYKIGHLALRLFDKYKIEQFKPAGNMIFYSFIAHWRQPYADGLEPLKSNFQKGLEIGDMLSAGTCAFSYIATLVYCGKKLSYIIDEAELFAHLLLKIGDYTNYQYVIIFWWVAVQLAGSSEEGKKTNKINFNEETLIKTSLEENDNEALCLIFINKTLVNYVLEKYEEAYKNAIQAVSFSKLVQGKEYFFMPSLVFLMLYPNLSKQEQRQILKKVKYSIRILKKWANESPYNYLHKYYLVVAEYSRIVGNNKKAMEYYRLAVMQAHKNEYLQDEAIANELAAKFYLNIDQTNINNTYLARGYINNAYYCYTKWGAFSKIKLIEDKYSHLLNQKYNENILYDTNAHDSIRLSRTASASDVDLATVMKAAQAINKEIILSEMLKKMMVILLENTGAQKCYFIIEKNSQWLIEAEGNIDQEPQVLESIPANEFIPMLIINYVSRTKKPLVIDNAHQHNQFVNDPYIAAVNPKSILCVPLLNQGMLTGVLYFENNLTENAFLKARVKLVNLLSSQIVTSLENARLYDYMKAMNEAYYRFVPVEFLNLLKKKDITEIQLGDQVKKHMSVVVCDIRNFTTISEKMTPKKNIDFINAFLSVIEPIIAHNNGFIDKFIGDAVMSLYADANHSDNALKCSIALLRALNQFNLMRFKSHFPAIRIGIGISSGLLMLGTIGDAHRMEGTVISDAVNIAFRIESLTKTYGVPIIITQAVYDDLKDPNAYCIRKLDTVFVKGKNQSVILYEVYDNDPEDIIALKNKMNDLFQRGIELFHTKKFQEAMIIFKDIIKSNPDDLPAHLYLSHCQETLSKEKMD